MFVCANRLCRGQRPIHPNLHPKSNELLRMLVRILVWDYLDKNPELLFVLFVRFVFEKNLQPKSQLKCARRPRLGDEDLEGSPAARNLN